MKKYNRFGKVGAIFLKLLCYVMQTSLVQKNGTRVIPASVCALKENKYSHPCRQMHFLMFISKCFPCVFSHHVLFCFLFFQRGALASRLVLKARKIAAAPAVAMLAFVIHA